MTMNLADHPNEVVVTTDDNEAKALLEKLGVLKRLEQAGMDERALSCQTLRLDIWNHPTHWITALRYAGFDRPEDNGFAVRCQPKKAVTLEMFKAQLETEKKQGFTEIITEQVDDLPPMGTN